MIWRIVYITLTGLVLAGIIHIAIVLMIPEQGTRDAWAFLSQRTDSFAFTPLDPVTTGSAISEVDPFFSYGVCRFDLSEGALKMQGPETASFWSASVFDDNGTVIYSLNERTAIGNRLDLLIVSPLQTLALRESLSEAIGNSVVIEANVRLGFVIIRVFEPDESYGPEIEAFLNGVRCTRFDPFAEDGGVPVSGTGAAEGAVPSG